jgi:hypothetical protein
MNKLKSGYGISVIILLSVFLFQTLPNLQGYIETINNRLPIILNAEKTNYSNTIKNDEPLQNLINKFNSLNPKPDSTYIYIDLGTEEGTMNYYRMRYNLIPMRSVKYQYFGYQPLSEEDYIRLIKEFDVNYFLIHRDNGLLSYLDSSLSGREDVIFFVNDHNETSLGKMLVEK